MAPAGGAALGALAGAGYSVAQEPETAGVLVVNTCGFLQTAVEEAVDVILEMAEHKANGIAHTLAVIGCLPERYGGDGAPWGLQFDIGRALAQGCPSTSWIATVVK